MKNFAKFWIEKLNIHVSKKCLNGVFKKSYISILDTCWEININYKSFYN